MARRRRSSLLRGSMKRQVRPLALRCFVGDEIARLRQILEVVVLRHRMGGVAKSRFGGHIVDAFAVVDDVAFVLERGEVCRAGA